MAEAETGPQRRLDESPEPPTSIMDPKKDKKPRRPSKGKIALIASAVALPVSVGGLWVAVHTIPWMGPLVANTLRATVGKENVTRLEDFAYAVEDRINRTLKSGEKPKAYWKVPDKKPENNVPPPAQETAAQAEALALDHAEDQEESPRAKLPPFAPQDPGPAHKEWSAEGDGQWVPMADPRRPQEEPRMFKTLLHPDSSRSWSELFVVAVDLRTVAVMPVMGYQEPRTDKPEAQNYERRAKIPPRHYEALLAAFNGGFMAEHGHYGVYFDGISFIDPKDDACTLASYRDGSFQVGTWNKMSDRLSEMRWYRQAPNCMYEEGKMHPNLKVHRSRKWGATLDGNTVIRRSAVGISADGQILYVGISNHTTAKVMASGMHHAGAVHVAQMDVNWSYPKFVTYEPGKDDLLYPVALAEGFEFSDKLYLRERSMRDFFYLARLEEVQDDLKTADEKLAASLPPPQTDEKSPPDGESEPSAKTEPKSGSKPPTTPPDEAP